MQKSIFYWTLGLLALVMLNGCTMSRLLRDHRQDIRALMGNEVSPRERFDGLATELAQVLGEATDFDRPDQSLKYLRKFSQQNAKDLRQLYSELSRWIDSKNTVEKIAFAGRAMLHPYARDLLRLVPNVQAMAKAQNYELGALDKVLLLYQLKRFERLN